MVLSKYLKYVVSALIFIVFFSCHSQSKNNFLDLSNKNLKIIPDLSKNTSIVHLDLSGNNIATWDEKKLPPNLNKLNISKNKLKGVIKVSSKEYELPHLKYIDLSYNDIEVFYSYSSSLDSIKINNNNIKSLFIFNTNKINSDKKINFLDISSNKELSSSLDFPPSNIKTIKRDNIKDNKELRFKLNQTHKDYAPKIEKEGK